MMRTTISLHESTFNRVKKVAQKQHKSLGETITELLNLGLQKLKEAQSMQKRAFKLPEFSMGMPRIDLEDKDSVYSILDEGGEHK